MAAPTKSSAAQVLKEHLKERGIRKDKDVEELTLSKRGLSDMMPLTRFKNLKFLWLNENMLRRVTCVPNNFSLTELHLNDNQLTTITGSLRHLVSMQVLMLHNNQLTKLEKVIAELVRMQNLHTLNVFNNPVTQEPDYRCYTIFHLPSLCLLDRAEIQKGERDVARQAYDQDREQIREKVAFLRRSEGPPVLHYAGDGSKKPATKPVHFEFGNHYYRDNPPFEHEEDAVNTRHLKHSLQEVSRFDWSKVPKAEERRMADKPFDRPQVVSYQFRGMFNTTESGHA